jgi:Zn-dependent protease/predicted transcriptional regulator
VGAAYPMVLQTGTIRVARIGGIAIEIHFTFVFVILWAAFQGAYPNGSLRGALFGIVLIGLLFGCILLHELGHGLFARGFGLKVYRIVLLPIGGIVEIPQSHPWQELVITLAGPMVNLGLAILFGAIAYLVQPFEVSNLAELAVLLLSSPLSLPGLLLYLAGTNLLLFAFNMLPAFPMDGGRIVRAGLALVLDYELATRLSAWLGWAFAGLMSVFALAGWPPAGIPPNLGLLIVSFIVFIGAQQEIVYVRRQRSLIRMEVQEITQLEIAVLEPWDSVSLELMQRLLKEEQALPVLIEGRVVGLLTYDDVRRAVRRPHEMPLTVAHMMRTHFPVLRLSDTLWVAFRDMTSYQLASLPVVEDGLYQGIVRLDDINHAWRFPVRRRRAGTTLVSGDTPLYD